MRLIDADAYRAEMKTRQDACAMHENDFCSYGERKDGAE